MEQELPLRDIHLPEAIGWWPPAIGWWLLPILLTLAALALWWWYRKITRRTALKSAKRLLAEIKQDRQSDEQAKLLRLSALLRRVAISQAPRRNCAGLTGEAWLRYLDRSLEGSPFSEGIGRCLADAHFRKNPPNAIDISALIELCERWLKGQKR